jgi:hypothetical protein
MKVEKPNPLLQRAQVIQVPPIIRTPIITMFLAYVSANGLEWSISRFKSIKTDFVRTKGQLPICTPWIKHRGLYFCGPLGALQRWAFRSDRNFDRAIQLLQLYTFYISDSVTMAQEEKFVKAVKSERVYHPFESAYSDLLLHAATLLFPTKRYYPDPRPLVFRPISSTKSEPHASGKSIPEGEATLECAESFLSDTVFGRRAVEKYPDLFLSVMLGVASNIENIYNPVVRRYYRQPQGDYVNNVGKIGLIQEPGFKLRAVANPGRVYQQALSALGDDLYGILKNMPWDCTHDQTFPFLTIQKHMRDGNTAHAVDLSNATDKFPFELQYRMLHHMYIRKDAIELFADLSRADWRTSLDTGTIQWTTGQPLGLYPSFASFALCHGLMLYALNGFSHNSMFYVLGDDVIILNDSLYSKYMRFLNNMGIPHAPSKTLSSNIITEFGGKLITHNRVIPQLKWRAVSDESFLDLAKNIGPAIRGILRPRQRVVFDVLKSIPDFLGGCGFNPEGKPLVDRMALYYNMFQTNDLYSYLLSYNGRISTMNYERRFIKPRPRGCLERYTVDHAFWYYPESISHTFDLKVISLFQGIPLFSNSCNTNEEVCSFPWKSLGSVIYNAYPRERFLQIYSEPSYTTCLDQLERKIKIL